MELSGHRAPYRAPCSVLPAPGTAAGHWGMCVLSHTAGLAIRLLGGSSPWNFGADGAGSPSPALSGALLRLEFGVPVPLSLELCWMRSLGSQPLSPAHSHCPESGSASAARGRDRGCGPGTGARPLHSPGPAPRISAELLPLRAAAARPSVRPSVRPSSGAGGRVPPRCKSRR